MDKTEARKIVLKNTRAVLDSFDEKELCEYLGCTRQIVHLWRTGQRAPNSVFYQIMLDLLNGDNNSAEISDEEFT